jgi:hypothetical protein
VYSPSYKKYDDTMNDSANPTGLGQDRPRNAAGLDTVQALQLTPYKYAEDLSRIADCPEKPNFKQIAVAFRFAHADLNSSANFLPTALLQPDRTVHGHKPIRDCCVGWSLSMFTSLEALEDRARKTIKTAPNFLKRVGDHYSQLKLSAVCGVHTAPSSNGHFEFFERTSFDGKSAVISRGKLSL